MNILPMNKTFLPRIGLCTRVPWLDLRKVWILFLTLSAIARAVDLPAVAPNGGTFTTFQTVTLSCATPDAIIHYTLNGLDPTTDDPNVGTGGTIEIRNPSTLRAKAFLNSEESPVKSATFNITGQVSTSGNHTLVLRADGAVWATGLNSNGQLGDGTSPPYQNKIILTQVVNLSDIVAVAAGGSHSLALKRDGTVYAWGANTNSQCGATGGSTPTVISGLTNVTKIVAGLTHSAALTSGGSVYTWGGGANGQQGNGGTADRAIPTAVLPTGISDIASSGGGNHMMALTGGTVKCWGSNSYGQCGGYPSYSPVTTPVSVTTVGDIGAITAGNGHSLAVRNSDGAVYVWGQMAASIGQTNLISGLSGVKTVAAGDGYTLALKSDNTVVALGSNAYGELGIGAVASASSPVAVTLPGVVSVLTAGTKSSIAITTNGNVYAWGSNSNGALGFGTPTQKNVPVQLISENIPDTIAIGTGANHNLITSASSPATLLTWGSNIRGELGAGDTLPYADPHLISGIAPHYSATNHETVGGIDHTLVVKSDGFIVASGLNTAIIYLTPHKISLP